MHDPASAKPRLMTYSVWQSLRLDLDNINVYAKFLSKYYARFKSKGQFHFFFNFDLGKTSTSERCTVQEIGPDSFFRIWTSAKPRPMSNDNWQSLRLDLANINAYATFHQNITYRSIDTDSFTFSDFEHRQSLDQ